MIAVDPLPEDKARSVVLQLLQGVEHLHSLNIVHLDLKVHEMLPDNYFIHMTLLWI